MFLNPYFIVNSELHNCILNRYITVFLKYSLDCINFSLVAYNWATVWISNFVYIPLTYYKVNGNSFTILSLSTLLFSESLFLISAWYTPFKHITLQLLPKYFLLLHLFFYWLFLFCFTFGSWPAVFMLPLMILYEFPNLTCLKLCFLNWYFECVVHVYVFCHVQFLCLYCNRVFPWFLLISVQQFFLLKLLL